MKTLDRKLSRIRSGSFTPADFVMADAGDSDMALGVAAAGPAERGGLKTRTAHLGSMEEIIRAGAVDVMLVSAANGEELARRGLFAEGPVTLAIRANDTTDIWLPRGAAYSAEPSRPFRTASLERVRPFCDLGLYSMTFNSTSLISEEYSRYGLIE